MNFSRRPVEAAKMIINPSHEELKILAQEGNKTTIYNSASFISSVRNRSAKKTYIVEDGVPLGVDQQGISIAEANRIADEVHEYLKQQEVIRLDRRMGLHPDFSLHCRLFITTRFARIPLKWNIMLFPSVEPEAEPDLLSIYVPEWPERVIFCHPLSYTTYILGTDYFGEAKKSFLRMAMFRTKTEGGLGFHAGSKVLRIKLPGGELKDAGFLLFGLSGTGKTTLTMHDHNLTPPEQAIIRQDDVVMMNPQGYCYGTENGFYIKTEGLDESQKVLYHAAQSPEAIFENVKVNDDGSIDFNNTELTSNGRGVIRREDVLGVDSNIDLDKAHRMIFITRHDKMVPPVAKLNPHQAAAFFMLGESVETSAGDPTKAGQSKREVGTNPFIVGLEGEEGNRLLEILEANPDMECYLLNTGSIGMGGNRPGVKISIHASTTILKYIATGEIKWQTDPDWGYQIPEHIPELDMTVYDPRSYYTKEEYLSMVQQLREERIRWLDKYPELKLEIKNTIKQPK
ncbi:phosphoenolpyruvate carboxykinase (ATP) [Desulfoscipio gibsoniae]|uniref:phosphoenolpyruvate carboxykinase (ATP) n=1 Tax=Desulfoscipio gibsoniae DSM 7213 TaxID=767817 RepID=R4KMI5_9FIRM|nr:phosphoenolpyruvate carboxykinase (ATP) [Desulfoscipio gibsoniae]AGL01750.1 phosphoenolpyruvate carboxykinase (ATP) [Desulfoscipio gibsoniae DSM 7213]